MVALSNYPSCCGAYVFTGFSGPDEECRASFVTCARTANNRMKWSFVLNDDQVGRYPLTLAEAHRMGFVLTNSWINHNHNSQLYEFERCGERITANSAAEKIGWVGRVHTPNLGGLRFRDPNALLDDVTEANTRHIAAGGFAGGFRAGDYVRATNHASGLRVGSIAIVRREYNNNSIVVDTLDTYLHDRGNRSGAQATVSVRHLERVEYTGPRLNGPQIEIPRGVTPRVGDICRVISPQSRHLNRELPVVRVLHRAYDTPLVILDGGDNPETPENLRGEVRLVAGSLRVVTPVPDAWVDYYRAAPPRQHEEFQPAFQEIHVDGEEQWRAVRPEPVAPVEVPRIVVHTLYRARYRDGRDGAGYETLDGLRAANPRAAQYTRQQVFSVAPFVVTDEPEYF